MPSSKTTSGKHQIYKVKPWDVTHGGTPTFAVYWEHGRTNLKYVLPIITARDELEAYTIAMKKLEEGDY